MTENGLEKENISTKRIDIQPDHILLFRLMSEKKEKAQPSNLLKFPLTSPQWTYLVLPENHTALSLIQKIAIFAYPHLNSIL